LRCSQTTRKELQAILRKKSEEEGRPTEKKKIFKKIFWWCFFWEALGEEKKADRSHREKSEI
jgi:hypothetical protein